MIRGYYNKVIDLIYSIKVEVHNVHIPDHHHLHQHKATTHLNTLQSESAHDTFQYRTPDTSC